MNAPEPSPSSRRAPRGDRRPPSARLVELAVEPGVTVRIPPRRSRSTTCRSSTGAELGADPDGPTDLAIVFGGDGTILRAMRRFAGRGVPVFAINFGAIGFLATVERDPLDDGIRRALSGDFDVLGLPRSPSRPRRASSVGVNDVSFHRRPDCRVAELGYSVSDEELGQVRCDGLVVATPAGSTGYNLANGGP